MESEYLITIEEICMRYNVEESFILSLHEQEIIQVTIVENKNYIQDQSLPLLEKMIRLHLDLGINTEGLHAIQHLLDRIEYLQDQMRMLKNRLKLFEDLE